MEISDILKEIFTKIKKDYPDESAFLKFEKNKEEYLLMKTMEN